MPRGVYDRSKTKSKKAAAPVAEIKKTKPALKAKTERSSPAITERREEAEKTAASVPTVDAAYGFNILGAGISTLSDAYTQMKDHTLVADLITAELVETVRTMTALRCATFGGLVKADAPVQEEVTEEAEEAAAPPAPATVATLPSLPQPSSVSSPILPGNAAPFQPPAPPLPHH